MSNYVIVPINSTAARPLATGAVPTAQIDGGGNLTNGTVVAGISPTGGSGSSATVSVTITGGVVGISVTAGGDDYADGDTLTIPVSASGDASSGESAWDADITIDVLEDMLVTSDSQAEELIPVDDVACVDVDTSGATIDILLKQATALKKWTLTLSGGDSTNYEDIAIFVNDAIQKAMQAENKQPVMTFPNGVSCYDVVLS